VKTLGGTVGHTRKRFCAGSHRQLSYLAVTAWGTMNFYEFVDVHQKIRLQEKFLNALASFRFAEQLESEYPYLAVIYLVDV